MTSPHHSAARLLACAATLACALSLALPVRSAAQEDEEPRDFCWAARPQSSCEMVAVAHFSYYPGMPPSGDLKEPWEWEFGLLVNRRPTHAVGGTAVVGMDGNGMRTAVKARYRRWLSRYAAVDASGGLAMATRDPVPGSARRAVGITGDVVVGFTHWASVGLRGDLLWSDGEPYGATYGTVRLGAGPGGVVSLLGIAFAFFALGGG